MNVQSVKTREWAITIPELDYKMIRRLGTTSHERSDQLKGRNGSYLHSILTQRGVLVDSLLNEFGLRDLEQRQTHDLRHLWIIVRAALACRMQCLDGSAYFLKGKTDGRRVRGREVPTTGWKCEYV